MGYNLLINGVYGGYNPLILTFDPNFQRDIQVTGDGDATSVVSSKARPAAGDWRVLGSTGFGCFQK